MNDKEMLELVFSLSELDEYRRKQIAILLLSTTISTLSVEKLAGFMVGLNESIENESIENAIPDKYQSITSDNADYFEQGK